MALVAVPSPKYCDDVLRPLIGLGEQHPVRVVGVDLRPHAPEEGVRGRQVLADRPLLLEQVRHRVEPEAVEAEIEPEPQRVEHRLRHLGALVVEVRLMVEEPVPVVRLGGSSQVQFDRSVSMKMMRASS